MGHNEQKDERLIELNVAGTQKKQQKTALSSSDYY